MKINRHLKLIVLLGCALVSPLMAQTTEDFFHTAAQQYINGQYESATLTVSTALQRFPNDPKLKALAEKLKREQQEQQQNQDEQQNQEQRQEEQHGGQDNDQNQQEEQQQQQEGEEQQQQQQAKPGELSKEEAERLLEALQNQEKEARKKKQAQVRGRVRVDKDW